MKQWELFDVQNRLDARLVRSLSLGTQTEGMVADDETGIFYIGHEVAGIWKFDAEPDGSAEGVFIENSSKKIPTSNTISRACPFTIEGTEKVIWLPHRRGIIHLPFSIGRAITGILAAFALWMEKLMAPKKLTGLKLPVCHLPDTPKYCWWFRMATTMMDAKKKPEF